MKHIACALLLALGIAPSLLAAQSSVVTDAKTFLRVENDRNQMLVSRDATRFTVDPNKAAEVFSAQVENITLKNFPVGVNETRTITLQATKPIFDANTEWYISTTNGRIRVAAPSFTAYAGTVDGEPGSKVMITAGDGELMGTMLRADGIRYSFSKVYASGAAAEYQLSANHSLNQQLSQVTESDVNCTNDPTAKYTLPSKEKFTSALLSSELREVRVAVEGTYDFYLRTSGSGNTEQKLLNAQRYIASVFAMVSRLYEDEVNTVYYLPYVNIWVDQAADPYIVMQASGGGIGNNTLDRVQQFWNARAEYKAIDRHVAHILMGKPTTPGSLYIAGIARPSGISNKNWGYSISCFDGGDYAQKYPALSYIWDVGVVAHEIGHNFGSPHTHDCDWSEIAGGALDTCVTRSSAGYGIGDACTDEDPVKPAFGSVMSYCHLLYSDRMQLSFGPIVARVVRTGAERYLPIATKAVVKIQYPFGREKLAAGATETIRWTSAKVTTVKIEYSTNSGQNWEPVATRDAVDRKFDWLVPNTPSANVLVRVYDAQNPAVGDTSFAEFTVQAVKVTLQTPDGGERLPQGEKVTISWNSQLVDSVLVEYSTDGGQTWQTLGTTRTSSMDWLVPEELNSSQVKIRLTGIGKVPVKTEGSDFAIGTPIASILNIKGGEVLKKSTGFLLQWKTDFITRIAIRYTTDNGATWSNVNNRLLFRTDLDTATWLVPNVTANGTAKIQILNFSTKKVLAESAAFSINADGTTGVEEQKTAPAELTALNISPNPVRNESVVHLSSALDSEAEVTLLDQAGKVVMTKSITLRQGENTFPLNAEKFAQGAYQLVIRSGGNQLSGPVNIVR